jgi:hypothetical protein
MKIILPPIFKTNIINLFHKKKIDIKYYINELPFELRLKIYKEYLEPDVYYSTYMKILNSNESIRLNPIFLRPLIPIILSKKDVLNYLYNKCPAFRNSYQLHKIERYKGFRYMTKGDSFTANILLYTYH